MHVLPTLPWGRKVLRLKLGRSYLWWFLVFAAFWAGGMASWAFLGGRFWAVLTLPALMAFVLSCELRSGVALDSWWRASYVKGTWQYRALVAWHAIGLVVFLGLSWLFITSV
jgi:hypothetical protein